MRATAITLLGLYLLAGTHAWNCKEVPQIDHLVQIDAGLGQVVATDRLQRVFYLSGASWNRLPGSLKHVSIGPAGLWGVNKNDNIYKYVGGNWAQVSGSLKQLDAGGNPFIVGANRNDQPYCLRSSYTVGFKGTGSINFNPMPGKVKYYSCGPFGCWAVNNANQVYLMNYVNAATCQNRNWAYIPGIALTMIEVATDGSVFGVAPSGHVYNRVGVSAGRPNGVKWTRIPLCVGMKHVSYDLGRLWVVSKLGFTMVCTH